MNYIRLSTDWNAEPNAPEVKIYIKEDQVSLEFYLNYFVFENFREGDKAIVRFNKCHKYSFNGMNDEGYCRRQYRYTADQLPWGEFYEILTNWEVDFPHDHQVISTNINPQQQHHYLFFFKDNCLECVAENYDVEMFHEQ